MRIPRYHGIRGRSRVDAVTATIEASEVVDGNRLFDAIAAAIREHGIPKVIATAAPDNHASHRVLLKAGMSPAGTRTNADGSQTKLFV